METATRLARRSCRICLLLFLLLFFPLLSELEFLMGLWLGSKMPPETVVMARWTLLIAAVATTSAGLGQLINALGRIKWYKIEITVLFLLCLPAGWILFKNGAPAYTILTCFVVSDFLSRIIQFILLRVQFRFDVFRFMRHAYARPLLISILMGGFLLLYRMIPLDGLWQHFAGFVVVGIVTVVCIGFLGFSRAERRTALEFLRSKIHKNT